MALKTRHKGVYWVYRRRKDGSRIFYYWAWRGGPAIWKGSRLPAEVPDDHPAAAAFRKAHADAKPKSAKGFVAGLVADFRASAEFEAMADSTRAQWRRWLDRIDDEFGEMELAGMDERAVRQDIKNWRDKQTTARQGDYALQVLKRVLAFGVDRGDLDFNRAKGIKSLTVNAQRAELIWTDKNIADACEHQDTDPAIGRAIRLAALTGLRRGDLVALRWDEVQADEIVRATNKSRGRHQARIPLLDETRTLLAEIKAARGDVPTTTVLATPTGSAWTTSYLTQMTTAAAKRAGVDRHLHDLRGTFATRLAKADFSDAEIAEIMGVSVKTIAMIRRTYVSKDALAKARIIRLQTKGHRA